MAKAPVTLSLLLSEAPSEVKVLLRDGDLTVLDFVNEQPPGVRVVGFRDREHHSEKIAAFSEREAAFFGGEVDALNALIYTHEKQVSDKVIEIRREVRKLAMLGRTLREAKRLLASLQSDSEDYVK